MLARRFCILVVLVLLFVVLLSLQHCSFLCFSRRLVSRACLTVTRWLFWSLVAFPCHLVSSQLFLISRRSFVSAILLFSRQFCFCDSSVGVRCSRICLIVFLSRPLVSGGWYARAGVLYFGCFSVVVCRSFVVALSIALTLFF